MEGKTIFKKFSLMMTTTTAMMMMMVMLSKFVEHMFFHKQYSNNNLLEERLTRFAIAWPFSQHVAKKKNSFMTGIPQC